MSRTPLKLVCVAIATVLALAACVSSGRSDPAKSGVVFGWPTDAGQNYDPATTASPAVGSYLAPVFDTLVTVDSSGTIKPSLSTAWEFGDNEKSLTMTLRPGVRFHDGTPFDASAVKANLDRGKSLPTSVVKGQLAVVSDVAVVNPGVVKLTLSGGAGTILSLLGSRAGMMMSPTAFKNPDLATHPVGTGPWEVSSETVPGKTMVYTKYAGYWDPSVQGIEKFVIKVVSPDAQAAGMNDGSINLLLLTSNPQDADTLKSSGNVVDSTGLEYVHTLFLSKKGVFANEHARLALSYAIDRQLIAGTVMLGQCTPTGQPFKPSSWAYDPALPAPAQNNGRVADELRAANLPGGFQFKAVVSGVGTFLPSIAQTVQSMVAVRGHQHDGGAAPSSSTAANLLDRRCRRLLLDAERWGRPVSDHFTTHDVAQPRRHTERGADASGQPGSRDERPGSTAGLLSVVVRGVSDRGLPCQHLQPRRLVRAHAERIREDLHRSADRGPARNDDQRHAPEQRQWLTRRYGTRWAGPLARDRIGTARLG